MASNAMARSVALAVVVWPLSVSASLSFPEVVAQEYDLDAPPACVLCHRTEDGGVGTATRPFATTIVVLGVEGGNRGSLSAALREVRDERYDSDADGYGDYDEIVAGLNPNDASDGPEGGPVGPPPYSGPLPAYGCAMVGAPSAAGVLGLLGAALVLLGLRRARVR